MLDALNSDRIFQKHSWLLTRDLAIVTSPDFDGLLCALLGAAHLDWRQVGFYDGQTLALATPVAPYPGARFPRRRDLPPSRSEPRQSPTPVGQASAYPRLRSDT